MLLLVWAACLATRALADPNETPPNLTFTGAVQIDSIYDFRRVQPEWEATLRPSTIPTQKGQYGPDGYGLVSFRQSRFEADLSTPLKGQTLAGRFEVNLFGDGGSAGRTTPWLQHAWLSWGRVLVGYDESLMQDLDLLPTIINYLGPPGMAALHSTQVRYTAQPTKSTSFAMAVEYPNTDLDTGQIDEFDPVFGKSVKSAAKVPDLTVQGRWSNDRVNLQLAGVLAKLGYDGITLAGDRLRRSDVGGGAQFGAVFKANSADTVSLGVVYGLGIGSYMADGIADLGPGPHFQSGVPLPKPLPVLGLLLYFHHSWNKELSSVVGFSQLREWNTAYQAHDAYKNGDYAGTNILWTPSDRLLLGLLALWGQREDRNGARGQDSRIQFTMSYTLTSRNFLADKP